MDTEQITKLDLSALSQKTSSLQKSSGIKRWLILLSVVMTSTGVMVLLRSQPFTGQNLASIINTVFSGAGVISTIIQTIFTIWPNSRSSSRSSKTVPLRR